MTAFGRWMLALSLPVSACAAQPARQVPRDGGLGTTAGTPFAPPARVELGQPVVNVPLTKENDFYFVEVEVNGRPFKFTLETGAGFFGVSQGLATALGLRVDSLAIMAGSRSPIVRIDSLRLGAAVMHGLVARVSPSWDATTFDGIISVSLLRDLLATLDLAGRTLRLERGSLPANDRDVVAIVGQDRGGRIDIPVSLGGVQVPAVLDTRSLFWIMTPDSLESRLPLAATPVFVTNAYGPAQGAFQLRGARLTRDMTLGAQSIDRPAVLLRNRPGTVIGVPLMEQFVFTLDQRGGRVRISRPEHGPVVMPRASWEDGIATGSSGGGDSVATPRAGSATTGDNPGGQIRRPIPAGAAEPPSGTWTAGFSMAGVPGGSLTVMQVFAGSSAEKEGLRVGDRISEFNGTPAAQMNPMISRAAANGGKPIRIVALREGRRIELTISPFRMP